MGQLRLKILSFAISLGVASFSMLSIISNAQSSNFKTSEGKAHFDKATQYSQKSNWSGAILELNRALQYEPRNAAILMELGIAYGELKQWNQAIKILKRAVEISPNSVRAHYNLGVTLDRANPGKGFGNTEYRKVLSLNPKDVNSLINLAANLGDQNSQDARKLLERALVLDLKNADAHFNLGLLLRNGGDQKGAEQALQKAIQLNAEPVEPRRQLVSILLSQQRWDETLEQCQEILKRNPNDWNIRYTLGQTLIRKGKAEEGKKELQKSQEARQFQQKQEELEKLVGRGLSDLTSGKVEEGIKNFRSALEIDEGSVLARMYVGVALATAGNPDQGIEELNKAIALDPNNARAHHNLGTVLVQTGQIESARPEFERALELDPYFPETHNNLGSILSKNNQVEKAIEHFRIASELNPQYLEALFNLGLALRSLNRIDEAAQTFRRAVEAAPDNAQLHYALGMTLKDKGDIHGAQEALDRANSLQRGKQFKPNP